MALLRLDHTPRLIYPCLLYDPAQSQAGQGNPPSQSEVPLPAARSFR